jgi:hypothetical protein
MQSLKPVIQSCSRAPETGAASGGATGIWSRELPPSDRGSEHDVADFNPLVVHGVRVVLKGSNASADQQMRTNVRLGAPFRGTCPRIPARSLAPLPG